MGQNSSSSSKINNDKKQSPKIQRISSPKKERNDSPIKGKNHNLIKERNDSPIKEWNDSPIKEKTHSIIKEKNHSPIKDTGPSLKSEIISSTLDFVPGVSNVKSGIEAITGKNYITGEKLSTSERIISGICTIPGTNYFKAGKNVSKIIKVEKTINNSNKIIKEEKIISKNVVKNMGRHGNHNEIKRIGGIPKCQQPDEQIYNIKTHFDNRGKKVKTGPIRTEIYTYQDNPNKKFFIREDLGHEIKDKKTGELVHKMGRHFHWEIHEEGKATFKDKKHYVFDLIKSSENQINFKFPNIPENENKSQEKDEKSSGNSD